MSTIVINNQEQKPTSMNTATLSTPAVVSTGSPDKKRPLDTAPPAPIKKTKMAAPMFRSNRYNWRSRDHKPNIDVTTGKDGKPSVQLHNASHSFNYQVMAPPGFVKWCHLGSGGDFGKKDWSAEEKGASLCFTYTNSALPLLPGEKVEDYNLRQTPFKQQQEAFFTFLKETHQAAFDKLYENVPDIKEGFMKKARAVLPKDTPQERLDSMGKKLFDKFCLTHTPLKQDQAGGISFVVKCSAFRDNKNGTFTPRQCFVYDGNKSTFPQHPEIECGDIKDGAILSPVFAIRLYTTPGNTSFGITYQLENRHIVIHKNGTGSLRQDGPLTEADLKQRQYAFKGVTSNSGNYNVYVNDMTGRKYLHRMPPSVTKYCDLLQGTLGKFPGVTESSAKFTATFLEDDTNKAYFDHIETLVRDAGTFLFNDANIMPDQKADLRSTAASIAEETNQSVEATMLSLFMENIQSPISQKGQGRELRVGVKMHKYKNNPNDPWVKNTFKYKDEDYDPLDEDPGLEPGCKIAMVIEPKVYTMNTGVAGVSLGIDLDNYIVVHSGISAIPEAGSDEAIPVYDASMFG